MYSTAPTERALNNEIMLFALKCLKYDDQYIPNSINKAGKNFTLVKILKNLKNIFVFICKE